MKKNSVLILGSSGMLGIEVLKELSSNPAIKVYATYRKRRDLKIIKKIVGKKFQSISWYKFAIDGKYELSLKKIIKKKRLCN